MLTKIINFFKPPAIPPTPTSQLYEVILYATPDSITGKAHCPSTPGFTNYEIAITDIQTPHRYTALTCEMADSQEAAVQKARSRLKEYIETPEAKVILERGLKHSIAMDFHRHQHRPATKQDIDNLNEQIAKLAQVINKQE